MNLGNREEYFKEQRLLLKVPIKKLERMVGELYKIRYEDQDITVDAYYRLAASVLLRRSGKGQTLVYHLKNYNPILLLGVSFLRIFII